MGLKHYLILMGIGTLLCWFAWIVVVTGVDPTQTGFIGFFLFYASLGLALVGTISIIGFMIRAWILQKDTLVFRHAKKTFRQGVLITGAILFALLLQSRELLNWWNTLLSISLLSLIELLAAGRRKPIV